METRSKPQLLVFLMLFSMLFSQTLAWPLFEAPSALRLGDRISFEEANEPDQDSLKADTDILQNALADNDTPYNDVSRNARHADGVFTSDFSRLLGQISAKNTLSLLLENELENKLGVGIPFYRTPRNLALWHIYHFLSKFFDFLFLTWLSNNISEDQGPIKRHSDAVFTDNYTRLRKQMAVKKYLNSILNGKRSSEGESPDFLEELEK